MAPTTRAQARRALLADEKCREADKLWVAPLNNEDKMKINFDAQSVTKEHAMVLDAISHVGTSHVNLDEDESCSECLRRAERDLMLLLIIDLFEEESSENSVTYTSPVSIDPVRKEIREIMALVVEDGAEEGSDEHFFATQLFIEKKYRDVFITLKTPNGRLAWIRRTWEEKLRQTYGLRNKKYKTCGLVKKKDGTNEPSDACSSNEDDARARRKRRSSDLFSFAYEKDIMLWRRKALFAATFVYIFYMFIHIFTYEKEDDDNDVCTEEEEEEDDVSTDKGEEEEDDGMCTDMEEGEEEDAHRDADLLETSLNCLNILKVRMDRELGAENAICKEQLDYFERALNVNQCDLPSAHKIFASKDSKFRSLMALDMVARTEWLLTHVRTLLNH